MAGLFTIVGLGEAVFDVFPEKEVLGGTSLNVAVQAHQLLSPMRGHGVLFSRIGNDELGKRIQEEFLRRDLPLEFVQVDIHKPTGQVLVSFEEGAPSYDIVVDTAWDHLEFGEHENQLAHTCDAVSFGSMSQRHPVAHKSTQAFLAEAKDALKIFDVNLRMDLFTAEILDEGCQVADLVKLNDEEIDTVAQLLDLPEGDVRFRAEALRANYDLEAVIFTRGKLGTAASKADGWQEGDPASFPAAENADSVGAGDACTAALLTARLLGCDWQATLNLANLHGAYVASQPGATPSLPREVWESYNLDS
jgi:fructokinase